MTDGPTDGNPNNDLEALRAHQDLSALEAEHVLETRLMDEPLPYQEVLWQDPEQPTESDDDAYARRSDFDARADADRDQVRRFTHLIETEPAAIGALNAVRQAASADPQKSIHEPRRAAHLHYHYIARELPNPGSLVERLDHSEQRMTPEVWADIRRTAGQERSDPSSLAFADDAARLSVYEAIFREIYGRRWEVYKDLTGFEGFNPIWLGTIRGEVTRDAAGNVLHHAGVEVQAEHAERPDLVFDELPNITGMDLDLWNLPDSWAELTDEQRAILRRREDAFNRFLGEQLIARLDDPIRQFVSLEFRHNFSGVSERGWLLDTEGNETVWRPDMIVALRGDDEADEAAFAAAYEKYRASLTPPQTYEDMRPSRFRRRRS